MIMRNKQKGFSLIELLIVVAIILIIAAIAIPNLLRAKMAANEASAVGSLRTINTSCVEYSTTYGVGFPSSLASLGGTGTATSASAGLIDSVLAGGVKSGYTFAFTPGTATQLAILTRTRLPPRQSSQAQPVSGCSSLTSRALSAQTLPVQGRA